MYCDTSLSKCMADIAPMSQYSHITGVTYVSVLTQHDEDIPAAWLFDSVFQLRGPDESFSGSGSSSMNRTPCSRRCLLRLWGTNTETLLGCTSRNISEKSPYTAAYLSVHIIFLTWRIMSFHDVWVPDKRAITLNMQTLCKRRKSTIILCICISFRTMCYIHFISGVLLVDSYIYTQLEKIIRIGYLPCHNPDSFVETSMLTELKKLLKKRYWFKIIVRDDLSKMNDIYWENALHVTCIAPDLLASP